MAMAGCYLNVSDKDTRFVSNTKTGQWKTIYFIILVSCVLLFLENSVGRVVTSFNER